MSGCALISRLLGAVALTTLLFGPARAEEQPQRVVSINLCTDQLAMLVAAPGQIVSVSYLAADPSVSMMTDAAAAQTLNHAGAEEVFLMRPHLVLAGTYTTPATVAMLRRLGLRVEALPPAASIEDIRAGITRMGALLGQAGRARAILRDFDSALSRIQPGPPRSAASYGANGYSAGAGTLSADVMTRAGLRLLSDAPGGHLPLERLVMQSPELLVLPARQGQPSRAEAVLDHPALTALPARRIEIHDRDWICGLPAITGIIERLAE